VQSNPVLTSLGGVGSLSFVHGNLVIDSNLALAKLSDAFTNALTTIDGTLTITNNSALVDIGALDHTGLTTGVDVSNNASLPYCTARPIGCCVDHPGTANLGGNLDNGAGCAAHSWCWNNGCPYAYQPLN
jgi:hypothetical protein